MKLPITYCALLLGTVLAGLLLRLPQLEQRPMHCDEAVHAVKLGELLENGQYAYDPYEYHGPTLTYLSLIPAWLIQAQTIKGLDEFSLRIVPVFFGVALIGMLGFWRRSLGWSVILVAGLLTAISPAMVYYSRYYIMEILLVCFTFGAMIAGYSFCKKPGLLNGFMLGAMLGLMHATKETCVIAYAAMVGGLFFVLYWRYIQGYSIRRDFGRVEPRHVAIVLIAGGIAASMFFSSFYSNPGGIIDSFRTYTTYFDRAGVDVANQVSDHINPWYYYLHILLWWQLDVGPEFADLANPVYTEGAIVLFAVVGFIIAMTREGLRGTDVHLLRFLAFFTLLMILAYSIIPYKTPWCLLGFLHGMILLAGVGIIGVYRFLKNRALQVLFVFILIGLGGHLLWQDYEQNVTYAADVRNPYVYAHTTNDVYTIVDRVERASEAWPTHNNMSIQVFYPENMWPLPWYLRHYNQVLYANEIPDGMMPAPLVIISPILEEKLVDMIYKNTPFEKREMYMRLFPQGTEPAVMLRPQVKINAYVSKTLWDLMSQAAAEEEVKSEE